MSAFDFGIGVQTLQIVGWTLLHSLWIGALIGVIFGVLRCLMRDHISLRYWLGVSCLFAFASIEIALFANALSSTLVRSTELVANSSETQLLALDSTAVAPFAMPPSAPPWTLLIAFLWLLGVGISAWRLMRSHHTLRLLARNAQTDSYSELRRLCAPLLEMLHLRTNVGFAVSELIDVPCVIGLFKPLVLLPAALLARMPQDQLELVLLHELSHIKNGDLWINSAQILLEVLMFFHPVVHWISADVRMTRERRCDRTVLNLRATPVRYAHALVSLEEFRHEFRGLALAATGGELTARVRDILAPRARSVTMNAQRSTRGTMLLSFAAAVVFVGAVSSAFVQRTVKTSSEDERRVTTLVRVPLAQLPAAKVQNLPASALAAQSAVAKAARSNETSAALAARSKITAARSNVIARKVLFTPRNLLAKQTLATNVFGRIAALELPRINVSTESSWVQFQDFSIPPKVIRRVQPVFVPGQHWLQNFTLSFSLDAAGIPQQISLTRGRASKKQLLAAQTALAQWRFEPQASARFIGKRVEQSFSFREVRPNRCIPNVGTRICR